MLYVASLRVSVIAAVAASLCALATFVSSRTAHAETCLAAPKSTAPTGSHWYYRLEHATQKKCWHLISGSHQVRARQERRTALRAGPQPQPQGEAQPQPQAEPDAPPVTAPIMKEVVQRLTQPFDAAPPLPAQGNAFAPVNDASGAAPVLAVPVQAMDQATTAPVAPAAPASTADAPAASNDPVRADAPSPMTAAAPPAPSQPSARPAVVSKRNAADPDTTSMRMLPFAIGALAAGLFAAALVYLSARRREQPIVRILDFNTKAPTRWAAGDGADQRRAAAAFRHGDENPVRADQRSSRPSRRRAA
jgi:hypothetical protein